MKRINLKDKYITKDGSSRMHGLSVPLIGLTGGIASGKSSVAKLLEDSGVLVIGADKLIKIIYQNKEIIDYIKDNYPKVITDGVIDFKSLRELAFNDIDIRTNLETILYSKLPETFLNVYKDNGSPDLVVYDVPLLFEKGLDDKVDLKVCVYIPKETQLKRLMDRDGVSEEQAEAALSNQMDIEEKKNKSDYIIDNQSNKNELKEKVEDFIKEHLTNEN
ncbi:MAG: dephospho-CoA kinase [Bacteriovoracaceae bacterium]|nr:dephospho-CoA kinase [Bacteriovoracaceae bacterium]